jgi:EAL domain-containing protein (putative c-di-GMP-specific phosphodiesterase class I)
LRCESALEHFGVTRSPFRLIEQVPVDYLTVDSSVVNRIALERTALERLTGIAQRARAMDKHTVAEYVEDARSVALLYDTGVEFVQGYYIQPPAESMSFEFSLAV